jgi:hypothetical protein
MKTKLAAIVGTAILALLLCRGEPPTWLLKSEVLIVATSALVYGFTAFSPKLPHWLKYQEVRGVTLVALGCVALFVPAQFIVSALMVGIGARLVMTSHPTINATGTPATALRREAGAIVPRPTTTLQRGHHDPDAR